MREGVLLVITIINTIIVKITTNVIIIITIITMELAIDRVREQSQVVIRDASDGCLVN